ncbi:junctophilin-1-like [Helianthus annuus]|uniref:junctophilin-1-like n=1 Tax=Helianthus annuus TaxID=4232 RepID=UPI000B902CB6|nr:junctophilin-1-like [Helianthus annuus]
MHGFGVYTFANGHRYEGSWHEGKRQGLGMYTFRNGETQSGHWQNGVLDVPSSQTTMHPVSPVAVYHSKVLNAIQEARRAAEKAYDVAKVDERVNRAVAAANRAANAARVAAIKAVQKQMHHRPNSDGLVGKSELQTRQINDTDLGQFSGFFSLNFKSTITRGIEITEWKILEGKKLKKQLLLQMHK